MVDSKTTDGLLLGFPEITVIEDGDEEGVVDSETIVGLLLGGADIEESDEDGAVDLDRIEGSLLGYSDAEEGDKDGVVYLEGLEDGAIVLVGTVHLLQDHGQFFSTSLLLHFFSLLTPSISFT